MGVNCHDCDETFNTYTELFEHYKIKHSRGLYKCQLCEAKFKSKKLLNRHVKRLHDFVLPRYICSICGENFDDLSEFKNHKKTHKSTDTFVKISCALNKKCEIYRQTFGCGKKKKTPIVRTIYQAFAKFGKVLEKHLNYVLLKKKYFKTSLVIATEMIKVNVSNQEIDRVSFYGRTEYARLIYNARQIKSFMVEAEDEISNKVDKFVQNGSGWILSSVDFWDVEVGQCLSLNGGCNLKKVIIKKISDIRTIKSCQIDYKARKYPNGCLLYAVAAFFRKTNDIRKLNKFIRQNLKRRISFPAKLSQISKFERDNEHLSFKINVLEVDSYNKVYPMYVSKNNDAIYTINLLWYSLQCHERILSQFERCPDSDNEFSDPETFEDHEFITENDSNFDLMVNGHFLLIEDINKFLTYRYKNKNYQVRFVCENCLKSFYSNELLVKHRDLCFMHAPQKVVLPLKNDNILQFFNWRKKFAPPYMIYYDFEALLIPSDHTCLSCEQKNIECVHKVITENDQVPCTFSILVISNSKRVVYKKTHTGVDCMEVFFKTLFFIEKRINKTFIEKVDMTLTAENKFDFENSTHCHICECLFEVHEVKVHDHDHFSGEYLGAAHNSCNLNRQINRSIPVYAHNAKNYDMHFIIRELNKYDQKFSRISALPDNTEKFRVLQLNNFVFLDTTAFLPISLDKLAENLHDSSDHKYEILDQLNLYSTAEQKNLLLRKGIYPFEYMSSFDKFLDSNLPKKEDFYSKLTNSSITDEEYSHAQNVFSKFDCRSMQDYAHLYCLTDVALLAEIILKFRDVVLEFSKLDMCNYISLPQLSFDIFLKNSNAKIELLTDINMVNFIENNIRGGLSFINQRYVTNDNEELLYIDANNLYGSSMKEKLPVSDFRWVYSHIYNRIDWSNCDLNGEKGYILEVDLEYPSHLHESHNSFPLAPEQLDINFDILSPYAKNIHKTLRNNEIYKAKKLTATFNSRKKYVLHFCTLQLYLQLGLKILKIHRVIEFTQAKVLESYIDTCTEKRKQSTKIFEVIFKLMGNSVYGKTIENARQRFKCHFISNEKKFMASVIKDRFKTFKIINSNLVVLFQRHESVTLNKPISLGFSILEYAKYKMYKSYYFDIMPLFKDIRVNFSDTDSFCLSVDRGNIFAIEKMKHLIDFSNYPIDHHRYNMERKNELGYFKDELCGKELQVFIGLKSKTYAMKIDNGDIYKKAKGITRGYKESLTFNQFESCIKEICEVNLVQYQIRASGHSVKTMKVNKLAFSSFEDKRYLLVCGIHSVPYGSVLLSIYENDYCPFCNKLLF